MIDRHGDVVQCSENMNVYWADGFREEHEMLAGVAQWRDLEDYDLSTSSLEYWYVSYLDEEGEDRSGDGLFWKCDKDHPGAFLVTRWTADERYE